MTTWANMNLQDSSSPIMEQLIYFFHDHALMIIIMILMVVSYMMILLFNNNFINRMLLEGQMIEVAWTIAPAIILIFIALPSLRLLYLLDEINKPAVTLKTIGYQWSWSNEYSDFLSVEFDSYMVPQIEMMNNDFRLLDDNHAALPMNNFIRIIITTADVLHSWTVPSLGVKADATPGRLNQKSFLVNRPYLFYGQCSEICGENHSFMPIVIESISINKFINLISNINE